jgi:ABC-2 type transport system ATP-binding protein
MHAGRIVREGTPAELGADQPSTIRFQGDPGRVRLDDLPGVVRVATHSDTTTVHTHDLQTTLHALLGRAAQCGVRLIDLEARNASLESVFLAFAYRDNDPDESASSTEGATR